MAEQVHLLRSLSAGTFTAKCGAEVTKAKVQPPTMTAWGSDVTCPACHGVPAVPPPSQMSLGVDGDPGSGLQCRT